MPSSHIRHATLADAALLAELGRRTFVQSHASSAPAEDIAAYTAEKYRWEVVAADLSDERNIYHILEYDGKPIGYSKIVFNSPNPNIDQPRVTKLDRLYFLEDYHGRGLGKQLFDHAVELAKAAGQVGLWLFVWTGNARALAFYQKMGFVQIGSRPFRITDRHYNPNFELYLSIG